MKILLALGNPGSRYALTRHNIGWMVADVIAERLRLEFVPGKGEYYEARGRWRGQELSLVKPTTYMNNSGLAAAQLMKRYGVVPADILPIVDELQFPLGKVQLKPAGSAGGHNGTESIIEHLGTNEFPRLRCGIGNDFGPGEMVEYVLAPFPAEDQEALLSTVTAAADAALTWVAEGTARAMNRTNTRTAGK